MKKTVLVPALLLIFAANMFALTDAQRWALALTEIMTRVNRDTHETLNFRDLTDSNRRATIEMLKRDWDIESRDELLTTLDEMEKDGHAASLEKIKGIISGTKDYSLFNMLNTYQMTIKEYNYFKFVLSNWNIYQNRTIICWDYGRNISLCRWGFECGYLSEAEAWDKIMYYAKKIQPLYASWKEYGFDYYMGRVFWASGFGSEIEYLFKTDRIYKELTADGSYWSTLNWNTDLSSDACAYFAPKNIDPSLKQQISLIITVLPHVVEEKNMGGYSVACQISDKKNMNYSDTVVMFDSVPIPYDRKESYGYCFSREISKPYAKGQSVTIRVESRLFGSDSFTLTVPDKPASFRISPALPEKGRKNASFQYSVSWDHVEGANWYLIEYIRKVIVSADRSESSGLGFYTDGLSYSIAKQYLTDESGNPYEWISMQLYALNKMIPPGYAPSSMVSISSQEIAEENNWSAKR